METEKWYMRENIHKLEKKNKLMIPKEGEDLKF